MRGAGIWLGSAALFAALGWAFIGTPVHGGTSARALVFDTGPSHLVIDGDEAAARPWLTSIEVFVDRQPCGVVTFASATRNTGGDIEYRLDSPGLSSKCSDGGAYVHLFARPGALLQEHPRLNAGGETKVRLLGPEPTDTGWIEYFAGGARPEHGEPAWSYLGALCLGFAVVITFGWLLKSRRASL